MKIIITEVQLAHLLEVRTTKKSLKKNKEMDIELDEQDAGDASGGAAATPTDTSSQSASVSKGYPKVTKWEDINSPKRGKANPLGKNGEKWTSGLNRGVANTLL